MDLDLTPEQQAVRDLAREFALAEVAPGAQARDVRGEVPRHLFTTMGELGFLGLAFPEAYGGSGAGYVSYARAVEDISRADAGVGLSYAAHVSIGAGPVYYFGTQDDKPPMLPGPRDRRLPGDIRPAPPPAG